MTLRTRKSPESLPLMKSLCLVLLLALSMPSCSRFSKSGRTERAYSKYIKQSKAAREKENQRVVKQRNKIPKRDTPPPLERNFQPMPDTQDTPKPD